MTCVHHSTIPILVRLQYMPEPRRKDKRGTAELYKLFCIHMLQNCQGKFIYLDRMMMMISYSLSSRQILKKIATL